MVPDIDLPVVQQHAVDSLNGSVSGLSGIVVNETVALGTTTFVGPNFA